MELFKHNFCESRIYNNQPELINSVSSLFIFFIPQIFGKPQNDILYTISILIQFNGLASCYFHYYLDWLGKQLDEIPMILTCYLTMWFFIKLYYSDNNILINYYNFFNTIYLLFILTINTFPIYNFIFPYLFGVQIIFSVLMIHKVSTKLAINYKEDLLISGIGAILWWISELYCTQWTYYGHLFWHLMFPLGYYKLILKYDNYILDKD